jgi:HEPN domain-containing protein
MNAIVEEWIRKADADLATARREQAVRDRPNFDAVCFHAQQAVEKLLKALLIACGTSSPRTHDLVYLGELASEACAEWQWPVEQLRFVSRAAVAFRYPGEAAEREDAGESLRLATAMGERLHVLIAGKI